MTGRMRELENYLFVLKCLLIKKRNLKLKTTENLELHHFEYIVCGDT